MTTLTAETLAADIDAAVAALDPERSSRWGVRVDCGVSYEVGDTADASRVWVDGEPSGDTLNGTSAVAVGATAARAARVIVGTYLPSLAVSCDGAPVVVLLRSEWAHVGEDRGEIVMRDAEVVRVWAAA